MMDGGALQLRGVASKRDARRKKVDDFARERNDLKLMSLSRLRRVGVSRAAPRMHKGFPTPFYCALSPEPFLQACRLLAYELVSRRNALTRIGKKLYQSIINRIINN